MFPYRISVPILEFKESIQEEASCLGNLVTQNLILERVKCLFHRSWNSK